MESSLLLPSFIYLSCTSHILFLHEQNDEFRIRKEEEIRPKARPVAPTPTWENRWQRDKVAWAPQHTRPRHIKDRDPALSPLIPRMPGYAARDLARPPAGIWWDANCRLQTTDIFGAMDDFKRHRNMGINYASPLFRCHLSYCLSLLLLLLPLHYQNQSSTRKSCYYWS